MVNDIKILLGGNISPTQEQQIKLLCDLTVKEVKSYCGCDNVDDMESVIIQIVIFKYNRIGSEGLSSESYSGQAFSYIQDYPPSILRALERKKGVRFI